MDMSSKGRKRKGSDGEDEEESEKRKVVKKKSIFDRENIHRKPFDVNEWLYKTWLHTHTSIHLTKAYIYIYLLFKIQILFTKIKFLILF